MSLFGKKEKKKEQKQSKYEEESEDEDTEDEEEEDTEEEDEEEETSEDTYEITTECDNCRYGVNWDIPKGTTWKEYIGSKICEECGCPIIEK